MGRMHSEMLTSKKDEWESLTYLPGNRGVAFEGKRGGGARADSRQCYC